ncbi:hypothetical protein BCR37DRAFT_392525 [Protomyces lactucae-debilis]|uniref:Uncharacterized protein n=1 Tax=Protomyces lactucae-debilis TaxID=2754530 RepID=A0A1Y2FGX4_PROLT|nr:uncharacterized protein BCR37DRAFT_392525 [Protomyces lactucae-debilis]ORY83182.1 hypothetical protein BCR37DRAFT_392525 [Protomyces lactucae-debilis]
MTSIDVLSMPLLPGYTRHAQDPCQTLPRDVKARIRAIQQKFPGLRRPKSKVPSSEANAVSVRIPIYCCEDQLLTAEQLEQLGLPTVTSSGQLIDYQILPIDRLDDEELPAYLPRQRKPGFKGWLQHQYRRRELVRADGTILWDEVFGLCVVVFFTAVVVVAAAVVLAALI